MKAFKRLFALFIATVFAFGTCSAFAAEVTAVPEDGNGTSVTTVDVVVDNSNDNSDSGIIPMSYDSTLTFATSQFSWDGECSCVLGWRASKCGIKAGISSNDSVGTVVCTVKFPNGSYHALGTLPSSGGMTPVLQCGTLDSGTYTFYFESSNGASLSGVGYIVQD